MAQQSNIEWTDATWNPWHGCRKISEGCKFCYMYRDKERWNQDPSVVMRSKSNFNDPLKWSFQMQASGMPHEMKGNAFPGMKIFTCSWSDFFIEEADEWRQEAWKIIKNTPEFNYQILTKRPHRIKECLPSDWGRGGYDNVWLGVSCENQDRYFERVPQLALIPAIVKFVSFEPLIGPIEIDHNDDNFQDMDWAIIGGESGNETGKYRYRPCKLEWFDSIIHSCAAHGIAVFVKQFGTYIAKENHVLDRHGRNVGDFNPYYDLREFPAWVRDKKLPF